jgi:tetratricopeptide (TPR) repeat protein
MWLKTIRNKLNFYIFKKKINFVIFKTQTISKMKNLLITAIFLTGSMAVLAQKGKVAAADEYRKEGKLDKALAEINPTVDPANKKAEKTIDWPDAWRVRGEIIEAIIKSKDENFKKLIQNPVDEAYKSYMKADELEVKYATNPAALKISLLGFLGVLTNSAVEKYHAEDYSKATEYFENVLNIEKTHLFKNEIKADTAIMFNTGLAAMSSKQYDKAIKYFNQCADLGYQASSSYSQMIRLYQLMGDTAKSISVMKEAAIKFPNEQNIMVQLINYYITHGQSADALSYLDKAIEKDPTNASFFLARGVCLDKLGRQEEAIQAYKKAIEIKPDNSDPYYNLGVIYVNRGVKQFEIANAVPTNEQARYEVEKNKADDQFKLAIPYLENAVKYNPKEENWKNQLKNLYYRLKMMEKYEALK